MQGWDYRASVNRRSKATSREQRKLNGSPTAPMDHVRGPA